MDYQIVSPLLNIAFLMVVSVGFLSSRKYYYHRKQAYNVMKKIRIIAYCIPLLMSIPFAIFVYQSVGDSALGGAGLYVIGIGFGAGFILFDAFEAKKIKSKTG